MEKQERKQKNILTDNRMATVNKRECSFEGLATQLEQGEDGIYGLITENKNVIFQPKISITQHDVDTIPPLRQLRESISQWEAALKRVPGTKKAYTIKKSLIEMRKDQYVIKQAYQKPITPCHLTRRGNTPISLDDLTELREGEVVVRGVSLLDPKTVSTILCDYSRLKEDSYDCFDGDTWYLIQAFEEICDKALADFPIFQRILELKIDKLQNNEIREALKEEFGTTYSVEYISNLWRNKIPKLIAQEATNDYIYWQYVTNHYPMKKCSKCGQFKPAHNQFFSKNNTSSDGFYSICKCCRNKKRKG